MDTLPLELIHDTFKYLECNKYVFCYSSTRLLSVIKQFIPIQIYVNETIENRISKKYFIYKNTKIDFNKIHYIVILKFHTDEMKINLNNSNIRHIISHSMFNPTYYIFPTKLRSLISSYSIDSDVIDTSELLYLKCAVIVNNNYFPKLRKLVIVNVPHDLLLPPSIDTLYIYNSSSQFSIKIKHLVNLHKLSVFRHIEKTDYPENLKILKFMIMSNDQSIIIPEGITSFTLITIEVKKYTSPFFILNYPLSLTRIKVPILYFLTYKCVLDFKNSNIKTIVITESNHVKFQDLPDKLETLILKKQIIPNPLPKSIKQLTIHSQNINHPHITILNLTIDGKSDLNIDVSHMKLIKLKINNESYDSSKSVIITLPHTLQYLKLNCIYKIYQLIDNNCQLIYLDCNDVMLFPHELFNIQTLRYIRFKGFYDEKIVFCSYIKYLEIDTSTGLWLRDITVDLSSFTNLVKLVIPYRNTCVVNNVFPKSIQYVKIHEDNIEIIPKWIKYVFIK